MRFTLHTLPTGPPLATTLQNHLHPYSVTSVIIAAVHLAYGLVSIPHARRSEIVEISVTGIIDSFTEGGAYQDAEGVSEGWRWAEFCGLTSEGVSRGKRRA
jgi:hypothetical protein